MLRRIFLHGNLKKIHTGPIEVNASTVLEAIKAVSLQLPGFRPNAVDGRKRIRVAGFDTIESLIAPSDVQDIHIVPQFCGGKQGGIGQILIGVVLVAASFFVPGAIAAVAPILLSMGASLILGGLLQLISAPKRDKKDGWQAQTYYLGPPKNTVAIGTRIPIPYGRRMVGGQYLSFNITATPSNWTYGFVQTGISTG